MFSRLLGLSIIIGLFLWNAPAFAEPLLACDPDINASTYVVEFDNVVGDSAPPIEVRADDTIIMDLAGMINDWGDVSEWSTPLEFMLSDEDIVIIRQQPAAPNVLRLLSQ
jgi:hypothetical protein